MSYYLKIHFKELKKEDEPFLIIEDLKKQHILNEYKLIETNIYFLPVVRSNGLNCKFGCEDYRETLHKGWLDKLFSCKLFYWEDLDLIGVVSSLNKIDGFTSIEFQNSTDQDYEYSHWRGIKIFENVVEMIMKVSELQLQQLCKKYSFESDDNDKEVMEYNKQSLVYAIIWDKLGLSDFVYDCKTTKYKMSRLSFLCDIHDEIRVGLLLHSITKELTEGSDCIND